MTSVIACIRRVNRDRLRSRLTGRRAENFPLVEGSGQFQRLEWIDSVFHRWR
jgi:hypothetical protein